MKRLVGWILGGLAVGAAVGALTRAKNEPQTVEPPIGDGNTVAAWGGVTSDDLEAIGRQSRWLHVALRLKDRFRENHTAIVAGSLAYYAMLSIFPAAIAAVAIYGLVLEPAQLAEQIDSISEALPDDAAGVVTDQLSDIVSGSGGGLGFAAAVSIAAALWSASAGTKALIAGINIAYGIVEDRKFVVLRGVALAITLGLIVFVGVAVAAVTFLPELPVFGSRAEGLIETLRWPAIFLVVILGLGALYKLAPNRSARTFPWLSPGALIAATLWVVATIGFSFYVTNLGNFNATYGTLGGVIVLLLWFFISGFIVLLGAELNAELEHERALVGDARLPT